MDKFDKLSSRTKTALTNASITNDNGVMRAMRDGTLEDVPRIGAAALREISALYDVAVASADVEPVLRWVVTKRVIG